ANLVIAEILAFPAKFLANLCVLRVLAVNFPVQSYREGAKGPSGNKVRSVARAPGGQMQGAATQAMWWHRRGAATPQMPARRRALRAAARRPAGCVARSLHTAAVAAGMLVARALPAGLGASSKMYTLFPDEPLVVPLGVFGTETRRRREFFICASVFSWAFIAVDPRFRFLE